MSGIIAKFLQNPRERLRPVHELFVDFVRDDNNMAELRLAENSSDLFKVLWAVQSTRRIAGVAQDEDLGLRVGGQRLFQLDGADEVVLLELVV
jgi:hypothetical protein